MIPPVIQLLDLSQHLCSNIFWLSDLNYRVSLANEEVSQMTCILIYLNMVFQARSYAASGNIDALYQADQVSREMHRMRARIPSALYM